MITIALTKGRILKDTLPLLSAAGIEPAEDISKSRKLRLPTNRSDVGLLVLRGVDVLTYIRQGAADIGIVGKDMLLEEGGGELYELVDLQIAKCRLMTAGLANRSASLVNNSVRAPGSRRKVATKYVNVARAYYSRLGVQADIIKLYGGMELAPLMNLAEEIVDIVDTGKTLEANGLEQRELIADISSRLVANKASMKVKHRELSQIVNAISAAVNDSAASTA